MLNIHTIFQTINNPKKFNTFPIRADEEHLFGKKVCNIFVVIALHNDHIYYSFE